MIGKFLKRLFGIRPAPETRPAKTIFGTPAPGGHRLLRDDAARSPSRVETSAAASAGDDGFMVGLATGIPLPFTPMSIAGAALHDAMTTPSHDPGPVSSCSHDSSSYGSSYDGAGSSSSCDSASSSSSSSDSW